MMWVLGVLRLVFGTLLFLISALLAPLWERLSWRGLIHSIGSHWALGWMESWLWKSSNQEGCICDCNPTQQFQHPCAFETAVCGNSSPSHNCLKYEPMHQIQATPLKTGEFVDSLAPQRGANSFSPVVVSSSWVVDGYSLLLAGVMWWNRRPRRL